MNWCLALWGLGLRLVEVLEVRTVRGDHQHVALSAHGFSVGLHAAIETVELRILRVRLGVHLARRRIALTASLRCFARGIGQNLGLLLVSLGARALCRLH